MKSRRTKLPNLDQVSQGGRRQSSFVRSVTPFRNVSELIQDGRNHHEFNAGHLSPNDLDGIVRLVFRRCQISRKLVSTAMSVDLLAAGIAIDQAHCASTKALTFFIRKCVGSGTVLCRKDCSLCELLC